MDPQTPGPIPRHDSFDIDYPRTWLYVRAFHPISNDAIPTMSIAVGDDESHLGQSLSICQLLRVVKTKLQDAAFGGRFVWGSYVDSQPNTEARVL